MEQPKHICDKGKEIDRLAKENLAQQTMIDERVKWTMFWAILLVLFGIMGTLANNIYSQIDEHEAISSREMASMLDDIKDNDITQAKIETQLASIQAQLADINVKLSKVR